MIRTFSMMILGVSAIYASTVAQACPGDVFTYKDVTLDANGVVSRRIFVKKDADGQNRKVTPPKFVAVVRDQVKLENNDEITLNASPTTVDAIFQVKIQLKSQERDDRGIFSTTYRVTEISKGTFAGNHAKPLAHAYFTTVKSNYLGNGKYSHGCGEVTKMPIDFGISADETDSE